MRVLIEQWYVESLQPTLKKSITTGEGAGVMALEGYRIVADISHR